MIKKIKIGNKDVELKVTAATPLHYRNQFKGKDMLKELGELSEDNALETGLFERMLFIMSGSFKTQSLEEWLEQFELIDIINVIPDVVEIWTDGDDRQSVDNSKNAEADEN